MEVALRSTAGSRYRLYRPPDIDRDSRRLPLLVMLHGCGQDALQLAASTQVNRLAAREGFLVLYPEQDPGANRHGCWNWYDAKSGRARAEALAIGALVDEVCLWQPVDRERIALAGGHAGAAMAALVAIEFPQRFRAVTMHSGIGAEVADSLGGALVAMAGHRGVSLPLSFAGDLPPLLVIHGSADRSVALINGTDAASSWAAQAGATPAASRLVRRGGRYPATVTDYRAGGDLVARMWEIAGLGHAWSGGRAGQAYSDPAGPDATRILWSFALQQFRIPRGARHATARHAGLPQGGPADPASVRRDHAVRDDDFDTAVLLAAGG